MAANGIRTIDGDGKTGGVASAGKMPEPKTETIPVETKRTAKTAPAEMKGVDEIIAMRGIPHWAGESIKVYAGWKSGKAVTAEEFNAAYDGWNARNQGGGRR